MPRQRIVSLTPTATELVCALGLETCLVGRSHACTASHAPAGLPVCTAPVPESQGGAPESRLGVLAEVDWRVDWEHVEALQPTHVVAHGDWRTRYALRDVPDRLRGALVALPGCTQLSQAWLGALDLADALGARDAGAELVASLQSRMAAIVNQALPLISRPRVVVLEWLDPPLASGGYIPEIIELGGGKHLLRRAGEESLAVEIAMLNAVGPDVILIAGFNMTIQRAREEVQNLTNEPEWWELPAVREEQVFVIDGVNYLHRPGPHLVESLEVVAEILHPDEFQFGHEGLAWQVL